LFFVIVKFVLAVAKYIYIFFCRCSIAVRAKYNFPLICYVYFRSCLAEVIIFLDLSTVISHIKLLRGALLVYHNFTHAIAHVNEDMGGTSDRSAGKSIVMIR